MSLSWKPSFGFLRFNEHVKINKLKISPEIQPWVHLILYLRKNSIEFFFLLRLCQWISGAFLSTTKRRETSGFWMCSAFTVRTRVDIIVIMKSRDKALPFTGVNDPSRRTERVIGIANVYRHVRWKPIVFLVLLSHVLRLEQRHEHRRVLAFNFWNLIRYYSSHYIRKFHCYWFN